MDEQSELNKLRQQIDAIDSEIHALLNRRAGCAQEVARVKTRAFEQARQFESDADKSSTQQLLFYRPEREAQVLARIREANQGPLADDAVAYIFREIMSACLALEKPMEVAYLGPEGTFTQAAALKHFGHAVIGISQPTIEAVFAAVESEQCNYGVVPVENSTEGMVAHTLDNFINSPLKICGEVELRIRLHLLVGEGTSSDNIKSICAHQQALAQSRNWLDQNFPQVERIAVSSNAEAARMAAAEPGIVAVAGDMAAQQYSLSKLASNIEDRADNTTRFLIIGRESVPASGNDKTSIVVSTRNRPGALFGLLEPFHRNGVMLTRIDTRPSRTETWAYVFFIEFEGHADDPVISTILKDIEEHSILLKVLGSYPRAAL
jgi:chorismate mutase/prephenate dehydratase